MSTKFALYHSTTSKKIFYTNLKDEFLIYIALSNARIEVWRFNKSKKKFVNQLQMRPCHFQYWFIFFWIKGVTNWVDGGWYCSKKIQGELREKIMLALSMTQIALRPCPQFFSFFFLPCELLLGKLHQQWHLLWWPCNQSFPVMLVF